MNVLCKIFNFFLNIFASTLNVAVEAAGQLIGAAFTVLEAITSGITSSPLLLIGGGLLLWWFLSGSEDDDKDNKKPLKDVSSPTGGSYLV